MKTRTLLCACLFAALLAVCTAAPTYRNKAEAYSYNATDFELLDNALTLENKTAGFVAVGDTTTAGWSDTYHKGVALKTPAPLLNADSTSKPFSVFVSTDKRESGSNGSFYIALGNDLTNPYHSENWSVGAVILRFDFWGKFNWDAEAKGAVQISALTTVSGCRFKNVVYGYQETDPANFYFGDCNGTMKVTFDIGSADSKIYVNDFLVFTGNVTQPAVYGNWCGCSAKVSFGPYAQRTPSFSYRLRLAAETEQPEVKASCTSDGSADVFSLPCADEIVKEIVYSDWVSFDYKTVANTDYTLTATGFTFGKNFVGSLACQGYSVIAKTAYGDVYFNYEKHHVESDAAGFDPTCTEPGLTPGKVCSLCKTVLEGQEPIPALNHDPIRHDGKAPTCTESGWEEYETCSRCDHSTFSELTAKGHSLTKVERKEATADEEGNIEYYACDECGKYFSDETGEKEITSAETVLPKTEGESSSENDSENIESNLESDSESEKAAAGGCLSGIEGGTALSLLSFAAIALVAFPFRKKKKNV